jgi:hypothetical protein
MLQDTQKIFQAAPIRNVRNERTRRLGRAMTDLIEVAEALRTKLEDHYGKTRDIDQIMEPLENGMDETFKKIG